MTARDVYLRIQNIANGEIDRESHTLTLILFPPSALQSPHRWHFAAIQTRVGCIDLRRFWPTCTRIGENHRWTKRHRYSTNATVRKVPQPSCHDDSFSETSPSNMDVKGLSAWYKAFGHDSNCRDHETAITLELTAARTECPSPFAQYSRRCPAT